MKENNWIVMKDSIIIGTFIIFLFVTIVINVILIEYIFPVFFYIIFLLSLICIAIISYTIVNKLHRKEEKEHQEWANKFELFCDSTINYYSSKIQINLGFIEIKELCIDWNNNNDMNQSSLVSSINYIKENLEKIRKYKFYTGLLDYRMFFQDLILPKEFPELKKDFIINHLLNDGFYRIMLIVPTSKETDLKGHYEMGIDNEGYLVQIKTVRCMWDFIGQSRFVSNSPILLLTTSENLISQVV